MVRIAPHGEHDWLSPEYVKGWIDSDATRDAERRPKLRRAVSLLPFDPAASLRVLDVGGGYGEFTRQVLEHFSHAHVVLHDYSPPMLQAGEERLRDFAGRVEFKLADLREPGWSAGLGGPFDAIVSSIAIHNLREPDRIHAVYREAADIVKPGGAFFNLDYIFPASPLLTGLQSRARGEMPRPEGRRRNGASADLAAQLAWLAEGFDEIDCLWKDDREVLLCGLKADA